MKTGAGIEKARFENRAHHYSLGWLMGLEPTTTGITILNKCHLLMLINARKFP